MSDGTDVGRAVATGDTVPALNHLFVAGGRPSSPDEYRARPNHVNTAVVDRVAPWILAQPPAAR